MPHLIWTDNLDTGIEVIDIQHKRIVDYINKLDDARITNDKIIIGDVIDALIDYTISHFGFEEALMEDAGYEFARPHKKVHELFIRRVDELRERFRNGDEILDELQSLLTRWLFSHIKHDDASYVDAIKPRVESHVEENPRGGWLSRSLSRFFRSA